MWHIAVSYTHLDVYKRQEYLNIDVLGMKGKSRVINVPDDRKEFWKENIGILRNPVIRKFVLREDIKLEKKAGISALCEYSLLSDNAYPTYAVTKKKLKASGVKMEKQASVSEDIGCVVLELGYFIDFFGKEMCIRDSSQTGSREIQRQGDTLE